MDKKLEIMLQPGEYYKDEFGNIITYEDEQKERLKDSTSDISSIGQFSTKELWDELGKRLLSK